MRPEYTGQDLADLHVRAAREGWDWAIVAAMADTHKIDHVARCIYLDGRLTVQRLIEIVDQASREFVGAKIIQMPRTVNGSPGRTHTG